MVRLDLVAQETLDRVAQETLDRVAQETLDRVVQEILVPVAQEILVPVDQETLVPVEDLEILILARAVIKAPLELFFHQVLFNHLVLSNSQALISQLK